MRAVIALVFSLITFFQEAESRTTFADGEYSVILKNGKKGLTDTSGKVLIPAIYDDLGWSDDTTIPVDGVIGYLKNEKWGLISLSNKKIFPPTFDHLSTGASGQIIASRKGKFSQTAFYGTINARGNTIIPFVYYSLLKSGEMYVALKRQESIFKYGIIDHQGAVLLPFEYVLIRSYSDRLLKAENNGLITLYNLAQEKVMMDSINRVEPFQENLSKVYQSNRIGLIDRDGKLVVPTQYKDIRIDQYGNFEGIEHSAWKVFDKNSAQIATLYGDNVHLYHNKIKLSSEGFEALYSSDYEQLTPNNINKITNVVGNKIVFSHSSRFGIYDIDKQEDLKAHFDSLYLDGEFFYGFKKNGIHRSWSVYDTFAIKRSKFEYEQILPYRNHLFAVQRRGHWGFIDRSGTEIIHCVYDSVGHIEKGLIHVIYHNNYGVIDTQGNWVVLPRKEQIKMISEEMLLSYGYQTTTLESIQGDLVYFTDNPIEFKNGVLIEILSDGMIRKLDISGKIIGEARQPDSIYQEIKYVNDELVAVKINGSFGMISRETGQLRITNRYQDVGRLSSNLVPVKILGKWGLIDLNEKLIVQPNYDSIYPFQNELAIVGVQGKLGIINKFGKQVLFPEYDELTQLKSGNFKSKKGDKYGLVNKSGRTTINAKYESLTELEHGHAIIEKGGKFGVVTPQGVNTLPQIFDKIIYDSRLDRYYAQTKMSWKPLTYEL